MADGSPAALAHPAAPTLTGFLAPPIPPLVVALVTFAVFSPALLNDFVEWDDLVNVVENPHYRGLGWPQLRWMFTTALMGHWIPLAWLTLGVDYVAWGLDPLGYHLTNVLLHAGAATVLYFVARRLLALTSGASGAPLTLGAMAAALFFGVHPLRAESVAWVTERRDVLSGLLFLTTVLLYLRAVTEPARRRTWLAASVVVYTLAAMAKSMVATLPAVLLVLDVYPLRRLPWEPWAWGRREHRAVVVEKLPYAIVAAGCAAMALWAITVANSYLTTLERLPMAARILVALYGGAFYASRSLVPVGFSPLHELPAAVHPLDPRFAASGLAVMAVTLALVALRRRWPAGLAAWVAYGIMVLPVSGLLHNGHQLVHDRYSYLPTLGFALLVGGGVSAGAGGGLGALARPGFTRGLLASVALALGGLGALAALQARVWADTETLWRYAIEFEPTCSICHHNLGLHLLRRGAPAEALAHIRRALALRPDRVKFHDTLGLALLQVGQPEAAIAQFQTVLATYPGEAGTLSNLSGALIALGRYRDAVAPAAKAIQHDPHHAEARINLGLALLEGGWPTAALPHLRRAAEVKPHSAQAHAALVRTYLALGAHAPARDAFETLRGLDAGLAARVAPWLNRSS